jgi:Tol biopolymer transport system component
VATVTDGELPRTDDKTSRTSTQAGLKGLPDDGSAATRNKAPTSTAREARTTTAAAPASIARVAPSADGPMFSPAFASNGSALFFHTGRSGDAQSAIATADLGADLHVMTIVDDGARNYHVQPSPDGTQVAFDSDRGGERAVYVANRDGSNVRRISGSGYAAVPTWSPDGSRLAFVRAETDRPHVWNLWIETLPTGETRRLTAFKYGQTWSASWFPDGRHICYTHEDRLLIHDLDTNRTREFVAPVRGRLMRTPAVSPDGKHVIFQVSRSGAWLLDLEDGTMRCVLTDPTAEEFAWAPDGRRVAFHSRRDGAWGIWVMQPS